MPILHVHAFTTIKSCTCRETLLTRHYPMTNCTAYFLRSGVTLSNEKHRVLSSSQMTTDSRYALSLTHSLTHIHTYTYTYTHTHTLTLSCAARTEAQRV